MGVGPCSFCGRSHEECTQLIAGPGLFICYYCVAQATALVAGAAVQDEPGAADGLQSRSKATCGLCGKQARKVQHLITGEGAAALETGSVWSVGSVTSAWDCTIRSWPNRPGRRVRTLGTALSVRDGSNHSRRVWSAGAARTVIRCRLSNSRRCQETTIRSGRCAWPPVEA